LIVLDASAAVELLLNTPSGATLAERLRSPLVSLHAPHLIDLEVAQTLRRYVREGAINEERGELALEHLSLLDLNRYDHTTFLRRIWELKENFTAYDAAYVALAETLDAPLITGDGRLSRAPGTHADIELLE
jgi:predicted nucleic acid-binding protein